ncbi:4-phosphoerythronate dehydrogenase PdxB [Labilibacter sediminis]|nr:4-phosphoerythronate dehydrogenase PdxB [Labilibacter sediminis]
MTIIADDKIPFLRGVLEPHVQISYIPGAQTNASVVKDADALITRTRTKCTSGVLEGSSVKMIATATIGFDHIDTVFCAENNIEWKNAPGCNAGSVKQYVASALAVWASDKQLDLTTKTIGIVGVGNVGKEIKDLAEGLGMNVLLNDPPRAEIEGQEGFVSLDQIKAQSDIITFHVPLQRQGDHKTEHMADKAFFEQCKNEVLIINSSRGEVVCNKDLLNAMNDEVIGDAVLDVWESEPDINLELMQKVFIATPHIAGYSVDGKANGTASCVQAISSFFELPLNDWYPNDLPEPKFPVIEIDAQKLSEQEVCVQAIFHTYNILDDDKRIRKQPELFEQQRGSYPMRREFAAFSIRLKNGNNNFVNSLNKIGFHHVQIT